jgi:hypothetical protein
MGKYETFAFILEKTEGILGGSKRSWGSIVYGKLFPRKEYCSWKCVSLRISDDV